ncbi:hypothetical protein QE250_01250 [Chromatiaceae bacterium AAb-1]|nr:hypothetical protein [Chromatiaceae bacterium AAb-1]
MKTLTTISAITLAAVSVMIPAQAASLPEILTELTSKQLAEISVSIKEQAKTALENTVKELFAQEAKKQAETVQIVHTEMAARTDATGQ